MVKIERLIDYISDAIGKTCTESMPMLQKKFQASEAEVAVAVSLALGRLVCSATAGIALGPDSTDNARMDLAAELANRISPILIKYGNVARENSDG